MINRLKSLLKRILRPLEILFIILVFIWIIVHTHLAIFDLDIWLHLKTGEIILKQNYFPRSDIYSFSVKGKPWINHSWLFQILVFFIYSHWGADGLILLETLIFLLIFFVLFLVNRHYKIPYVYLGAILFWIAYLLKSRFNIRPDIFSILFFVLYMYILNFHLDKKLIFLLLILQIGWVNMHGYFFLGPLLVLFFIISYSLEQRFFPKENNFLILEKIRILKRLFLFLILVSFLNPSTFRGCLYPFYILKRIIGSDRVFFRYVIELQPFFKINYKRILFFYLVFNLLLFIFNFKKTKPLDWILFLFFIAFGFPIRNLPFFLLSSYFSLVHFLNLSFKKIYSVLDKKRWSILYYFMVMVLLIFISRNIISQINVRLRLSYYDFKDNKFKSKIIGVDESIYPKEAVDFLWDRFSSFKDKEFYVLNNFNSGAYLIGRGYPLFKVFIDGRTELYGGEFLTQYNKILDGDYEGFLKLFNQYNFDIVFFYFSRPTEIPNIVKNIYEDPLWKLIYFDDRAVIFLKDSPLTKSIIETNRIDFNNYKPPSLDTLKLGLHWLYPYPFINRAEFLYKIGEKNAMYLECQKALEVLPACAKAYHLIGKFFLDRNEYNQAYEYLRKAALFSSADDILKDLATCLGSIQQYKETISVLKKVVKSRKNKYELYYKIAELYLKTDNLEEAIRYFKKAMQYNPENAHYLLRYLQTLNLYIDKTKDKRYIAEADYYVKQIKKFERNYKDNQLVIKIKEEFLKLKNK